MPKKEWLGCLPWDGEEKSLPTGGQIRNPNLGILDFVEEYVVLKDGKIIKVKDPKVGKLINVEIYEELFDELVKVYGKRAVVISRSDPPKDPNEPFMLTRWEWRDKYKTDGLKLWAIRAANQKQRS